MIKVPLEFSLHMARSNMRKEALMGLFFSVLLGYTPVGRSLQPSNSHHAITNRRVVVLRLNWANRSAWVSLKAALSKRFVMTVFQVMR